MRARSGSTFRIRVLLRSVDEQNDLANIDNTQGLSISFGSHVIFSGIPVCTLFLFSLFCL